MADLELEHCIGGLYTVPNALHLHPNGKNFVSIAGAAVVISDISDPHNQSFLKGHDGTICNVTMSENGKYIASGQLGDDADIYVWDFETKKLVHKLCQHEHGISTMAFTADGRLLLTVGDFFDRKLFVWDMESGGIVANVQLTSTGSSSLHQSGMDKRPPPQVSKVSASLLTGSSSSSSSSSQSKGTVEEGDFVASCWGGRARDIKRRETSDLIFATAGPNMSLWTLTPSTGELVQDKFQTNTTNRSFTAVAFTADGERCIGGTESGDFLICLVRTLVMEVVIPACSGGVRSLCVTRTNDIIVGGGDGTLTMFSAPTPAPSSTSAYFGSSSSSTQFRPKNLVMTQQFQLTEGKQAITAISMVHATNRCITASLDGTVYAINTGNFQKSVPISFSHAGSVNGLSFPVAISEKFATCSADDETVRVWDLSTYETSSLCKVPKQRPTCVDWCGDCLCIGYQNGAVRFVDAYSGDVLWVIDQAHRGDRGTTAIKAASDNSFLVSAGCEGEIRMWDVRTRKMQWHLKEHATAVTQLQLFADGNHLVSSSRDRTWCCVDTRKERRVAQYKYASAILDLALFPDEQRVLTVHADRSVVFWDLSIADPAMVITDAHQDQINSVAIAHDTDLFATGGADSVIRLWDMRGKLLNTYSGHTAAINSIGFTPDDKQLVSVGEDGNCLIWDLF